jgi:hypothetical protein
MLYFFIAAVVIPRSVEFFVRSMSIELPLKPRRIVSRACDKSDVSPLNVKKSLVEVIAVVFAIKGRCITQILRIFASIAANVDPRAETLRPLYELIGWTT